jgi:hypothetical protein
MEFHKKTFDGFFHENFPWNSMEMSMEFHGKFHELTEQFSPGPVWHHKIGRRFVRMQVREPHNAAKTWQLLRNAAFRTTPRHETEGWATSC